MNLFVNCALFTFCINKVYSRIHLNTFLTNSNQLIFIRKWNMTSYRTCKYFSQSSMSLNKAIENPVTEVKVVPVLVDNFSYVFKDPYSSKAICVDPAEPKKVYQVSKKYNWDLSMLLCTHKHWDHSGGNVEMKKLVPDIEVVGSSYEDTPGLTKQVNDGDVLTLGILKIKCFKAPCHTMGHIMYYVYSDENPISQPLLFTGDTLFVAGCGRFFEGTASMMLDIVRRVQELPPDTLLYCGHEYTIKNLKFAKTVDKSKAIREKLDWATDVVADGGVTVPSLLSEELTYNPFMRTKHLMESLGVETEEQAMSKLRTLKDIF